MNRYEGMFLVDNAIATSDWDNIVNHIQDVLTKHGAEIIETLKWDERKLAYNIGNHSRGTYIIIRFKSPGLSISKIRKDYELSDKIIRTLIVRDDNPEDHAIAVKESTESTDEESQPATAEVGS